MCPKFKEVQYKQNFVNDSQISRVCLPTQTVSVTDKRSISVMPAAWNEEVQQF